MAKKTAKSKVSQPQKPGPKLASEGDRKVPYPAAIPQRLAEACDKWRAKAGLTRSQAVTEAIRRLVS